MDTPQARGTALRVSIALIPPIGFLITPLLPFAQQPTLWFGIPAVLVWTAAMVLLTVATLQLVDVLYSRQGGRELDRWEEEGRFTE